MEAPRSGLQDPGVEIRRQVVNARTVMGSRVMLAISSISMSDDQGVVLTIFTSGQQSQRMHIDLPRRRTSVARPVQTYILGQTGCLLLGLRFGSPVLVSEVLREGLTYFGTKSGEFWV